MLSQGKLSLRGLPWFLLPILAVIQLALLPACSQVPSTPAKPLKAVINDQLYCIKPNEAVIHQMTQKLEDYGFEVDIYQG